MGKVCLIIIVVIGTILNMHANIIESDSAYTIEGTDGNQCSGNKPQGAWTTDETWASSGGLQVPPVEDWSGSKIVIRHDIIICNNDDIDLGESNIDTIIMRSNSSLRYVANSTLILPANAVLIMETGAKIFVSNQSQGTLLQIGNDSIWGKEVNCTVDIDGPITLTNQSEICFNDLLPVKLVSFEVYAENNSAILDWTTASEINSSHFELYKSSDGLKWQHFESVDAAGFSSSVTEYRVEDESPYFNLSYYKLVQFDLNGDFETFPLESFVLNEEAIGFQIINNPVNDYLKLKRFNELSHDLSGNIINVKGEIITSFKIEQSNSNKNIREIPVNHLDKGMYIVNLFSGQKNVIHSQRFIKL